MHKRLFREALVSVRDAGACRRPYGGRIDGRGQYCFECVNLYSFSGVERQREVLSLAPSAE